MEIEQLMHKQQGEVLNNILIKHLIEILTSTMKQIKTITTASILRTKEVWFSNLNQLVFLIRIHFSQILLNLSLVLKTLLDL